MEVLHVEFLHIFVSNFPKSFEIICLNTMSANYDILLQFSEMNELLDFLDT